MTKGSLNLTASLVDQIDWHWRAQARPRLDGLTDDEYFWEPVDGCWSLRPRGASQAPMAVGAGDVVCEYGFPPPDPEPVTTIAWRLAHLMVGVLGARLHGHFGGPAVDYESYDYAGSADEALRRLDDLYAQWISGVSSWAVDDLAVPVGDAEPPQFAEAPRLDLVLHIHRELIHHLSEVALMRDLYAHRPLRP